MTHDNRTLSGCLRLILTLSVFSMPWLLGGCAGSSGPNALSAADSRLSVQESVREASARFNMPVSWINAVMRQESGGRANSVSPKGAMGLMQLMPATWNYLRAAYKLGDDPYNPHDNIIAGTAYLREMYDLYGSPGFLAAYNAGPGRYESCVRRHRALPAETRHYVAVIAPKLEGAAPEGASPTRPTAVASLPPALLEAAVSDVSGARLPPAKPAPRFAAAAFGDSADDEEDTVAPRPSRSPVAQSHAAAPAPRQTERRAAATSDHRLPEHRPPLPPGWYVPVAYGNR